MRRLAHVRPSARLAPGRRPSRRRRRAAASLAEWLHLFEMLTREGLAPNGTRMLQPETVRTFTAPRRVG
eukprot:913627-Prymnesium_polylepis.1